MTRLALSHDADVMVVDGNEIGPEGTIPERLALLLQSSPCDVALLAGSAPLPFADRLPSCSPGASTTGQQRSLEHGSPPACPHAFCSSASAVVTATRAGSSPRPRSPSSRSSASISSPCSQMRDATARWWQRVRPRWSSWGCRHAGDERASGRRGAPSSSAVSSTLVVHRGARPGGLAPREQLTRFTWSIAAGG